ncbi:MAG: Flp pilus assembly complex ATPase component TadA [Deltaproteobacteria bacterium]|nr:MAG: Flp pilus assembly complex ATPase component TadA [Deltaproteobacteria bacterium]
MGLLAESLSAYEKILSDIPTLDSHNREKVEQTIGQVKKEIVDEEQANVENVSTEDISILKKAVSNNENVQAVLASASAWKELGLYGEAVAEYEKLFQLDCHSGKIVSEMVACLSVTHSLSKVVEHVEKIVNKQKLGKKEKVQIKFRLGMEMEKRGEKELALDLYRSAKQIDPDDKEVKKKLDSIIASLSSGSKYDYLLNQKMVTPEQLHKALGLSKKMNKSVEFILIEYFRVEKEELGKSLSLFYGCPFRTYDPALPTPVELIRSLRKPFLLHEVWVPLSWGKEGIEILIDDPRDLTKTDHIRALVKTKKISFSVAIREDIEPYIKRFFDDQKIHTVAPGPNVMEGYDLIPDISFEEEEEGAEIEETLFDETSSQVVNLVDQIIIAAYRRNASDIHFEPSQDSRVTTVRFRIDGVCQDYTKVPNSMIRAIIIRIKIMAGVDIAEKRLPHDGKIKFKRKGISPFELRLATLPTAGGYEDAVLRILSGASTMHLDEMGLNERNLNLMKKIVSQPYGLVLVVGPTGSGKTTTLHAALGFINKPGIKIWTAEDPVEITQPGLRQVEVKPKIGLDFAMIMRAFLRADPDVIMIGEMRDEETAATAIEASLTGHLVFSTLHTNSAPETVTRLLDMGLNALNFSEALLGVLAQRLVRRLCKKCRQEYHPSEDEFQEIVSDYGTDHFDTTGIEFTPDLTLYRPQGCEECSGTGYKGRLGIYELLYGSNVIKRMIKKQAGTDAILEQAAKEGMTTMKQDAVVKVFQGITDISEVRRVCIK